MDDDKGKIEIVIGELGRKDGKAGKMDEGGRGRRIKEVEPMKEV